MSADRPRFVLDTNVLVSAALFSASTPRRAVAVARMQGDLFLSTALFREFRDVFSRPKIDRYVPVEARIEFLLELERTSLFVPIRETVQACRDPKDDRVLEVAVNGGAACIVSGDDDLLVLHPFRGILILSPAASVERVGLLSSPQ